MSDGIQRFIEAAEKLTDPEGVFGHIYLNGEDILAPNCPACEFRAALPGAGEEYAQLKRDLTMQARRIEDLYAQLLRLMHQKKLVEMLIEVVSRETRDE